MDSCFRLLKILSCSISFFLLGICPALALNTVEIKNDWFYVNGEKFFVKGINYHAYRPGQSPSDGDKVNLDLVDDDFRLIKEAGFNTIRTAGALSRQIETLAQKHGLFVLHGIWFDKDRDYTSDDTLTYAQELLNKDLVWAKDFDNVLGYLFLNEPPMERVRDAGQVKTEEFLKDLTRFVKTADPQKFVSFASWVPLGFVDHSFLDFVGFNAYIYSPNIVANVFGYAGYLQWLKENVSRGKPLIITEFGLSVSQMRKGGSHYGYGGNSFKEQAQGDIEMYDGIIQSGATGGCAFLWTDAWWLAGSKSVHDNDPEDYFGINDYDKDGKAIPREAFFAFKQYNQALVIEPKHTQFYQKKIPIEIYTTKQVNLVLYRIDQHDWQELKKTGDLWWGTDVDIDTLSDGKHQLEIKAMDFEKNILCEKNQDFWVGKLDEVAPYKVSIETDRTEYSLNEKVQVTVTIKDALNNTISDQVVNYSVFQAIGWQDHAGDLKTDQKGQIKFVFSPFIAGYVNIAAGVEYKQEYGFVQRYGNLKTIFVKGN